MKRETRVEKQADGKVGRSEGRPEATTTKPKRPAASEKNHPPRKRVVVVGKLRRGAKSESRSKATRDDESDANRRRHKHLILGRTGFSATPFAFYFAAFS